MIMVINPDIVNKEFQSMNPDAKVFCLLAHYHSGILEGESSYHSTAYTTREEAENHWWITDPEGGKLLQAIFPYGNRGPLPKQKTVEIVELTMRQFIGTLTNPCNPFVAVNRSQNIALWSLNNK